MKRILLALICLGFVAFAGNNYWNFSPYGDSAWSKKADNPYVITMIDTSTIHVKNGDVELDLGSIWYNFRIRSLNAAADSGYVKISFGQDGGHGIWHADSVSRNLLFKNVGYKASPYDSTLYGAIGARYIYIRPVVGGTADSTIKLEIKAYR